MPGSALLLALVLSSAGRLELTLPADVELVGLAAGLRPELTYRLGDAEQTRSRLRFAVGALYGPEFFFVPVSVGYRAQFRNPAFFRPFLGGGVEQQLFVIQRGPDVVRWFVPYVEFGTQLRVTEEVSAFFGVSADFAVLNEPGFGLGLRAGVSGWP